MLPYHRQLQTCEAVWFRRILEDLKFKQNEPTDVQTIHCYNMSAIAMIKNTVFHVRFKHTEIRHHFILELVNQGEIFMQYINTSDQTADFLTKAVTSDKFGRFKKQIKITN